MAPSATTHAGPSVARFCTTRAGNNLAHASVHRNFAVSLESHRRLPGQLLELHSSLSACAGASPCLKGAAPRNLMLHHHAFSKHLGRARCSWPPLSMHSSQLMRLPDRESNAGSRGWGSPGAARLNNNNHIAALLKPPRNERGNQSMKTIATRPNSCCSSSPAVQHGQRPGRRAGVSPTARPW
jgi:hypothetical protein